tara:strand:+ start:152 stop:322 length:171 start_codon:yes stop_codon:yes gene_type:complete
MDLEKYDTNEVHEFLNDLREFGTGNMFGAVKDLMNEFNMDKKEAKHYLLAWMKTYN